MCFCTILLLYLAVLFYYKKNSWCRVLVALVGGQKLAGGLQLVFSNKANLNLQGQPFGDRRPCTIG